MAVYAYIYFDGNCRDAVEFYRQVFGAATPEIMHYGDVPPDIEFPVQEEHKHLVMHTALDIFGSTVMFSDSLPGESFVTGNNISLIIIMENIDEIKPLFDRLKDGGSVVMDLQETFWSKYYGIVKDKFGVEWQLMLESEEM